MSNVEVNKHAALPRSKRRRYKAGAAVMVNRGDRVFYFLLKSLAFLVFVIFFLIFVALIHGSWPAIQQFGLEYFYRNEWNPPEQDFGALAFVYGTLVTSALALLFAVPVSVATALFLSEIAPSVLRRPMGFLVEMLAAIPSVVYGFWGVFVLVPWMREYIQPFLKTYFGYIPWLFEGEIHGWGLLTAGVVLAVMITPTITAVSREVFRSVPPILREGALALGATRWESLRWAVIATAKAGILGAIILGLGRALGETMAVTMVIGNRPEVSGSLFSSGATLASMIASEFREADSDLQVSALTALGLFLFVVSFIVNWFARRIVRSVAAKSEGTL